MFVLRDLSFQFISMYKGVLVKVQGCTRFYELSFCINQLINWNILGLINQDPIGLDYVTQTQFELKLVKSIGSPINTLVKGQSFSFVCHFLKRASREKPQLPSREKSLHFSCAQLHRRRDQMEEHLIDELSLNQK